MQLTLSTDYALRILTYLGAKGTQRATIAEIAACFVISKTHLMKVVQRLGQRGYIETLRGRGGGITLARPAAEIGVGAVVREMEEALAVMGCLDRGGYCRIETCCVLRGALREATAAFLSALDGYTLADLLTPRAPLAHSLGLAPPGIARRRSIGHAPAA